MSAKTSTVHKINKRKINFCYNNQNPFIHIQIREWFGKNDFLVQILTLDGSTRTFLPLVLQYCNVPVSKSLPQYD